MGMKLYLKVDSSGTQLDIPAVLGEPGSAETQLTLRVKQNHHAHLGLHQSRQVFHFRFNACSREWGVYRLILLTSIDQEQSSLNGTDSHNELL